MNCCICDRPIPARGDWTTGNNAEPVADGRCCDDCNAKVVVPTRLLDMVKRGVVQFPIHKKESE